jgi:hypothetical protein
VTPPRIGVELRLEFTAIRRTVAHVQGDVTGFERAFVGLRTHWLHAPSVYGLKLDILDGTKQLDHLDLTRTELLSGCHEGQYHAVLPNGVRVTLGIECRSRSRRRV